MDQDEKERRRLEVLLKVQEDARGEIRQRITQRDSFGASLIVAIGGILTISVSVNSYASFLVFLIPLFTDFFAMQIFYSYSIHEGLSNFLSDCIEPKISELMGVGKGQRQFYLWESPHPLQRALLLAEGPFHPQKFLQDHAFRLAFHRFDYFRPASDEREALQR